jgi:hypothetical protein
MLYRHPAASCLNCMFTLIDSWSLGMWFMNVMDTEFVFKSVSSSWEPPLFRCMVLNVCSKYFCHVLLSSLSQITWLNQQVSCFCGHREVSTYVLILHGYLTGTLFLYGPYAKYSTNQNSHNKFRLKFYDAHVWDMKHLFALFISVDVWPLRSTGVSLQKIWS